MNRPLLNVTIVTETRSLHDMYVGRDSILFIFLLLLFLYCFAETRTFQFTDTARDKTASREPAYPCVYPNWP